MRDPHTVPRQGGTLNILHQPSVWKIFGNNQQEVWAALVEVKVLKQEPLHWNPSLSVF